MCLLPARFAPRVPTLSCSPMTQNWSAVCAAHSEYSGSSTGNCQVAQTFPSGQIARNSFKWHDIYH